MVLSDLGDFADYFRKYGLIILIVMVVILSYVVITYVMRR